MPNPNEDPISENPSTPNSTPENSEGEPKDELNYDFLIEYASYDDEGYESEPEDDALEPAVEYRDANDDNYAEYLLLLIGYLLEEHPQLDEATKLMERCPSLINYINAPISTEECYEDGYIELPPNAPLLVIAVASLSKPAVDWLLEHNAEQSSAFFPLIVNQLFDTISTEIRSLEEDLGKLKDKDSADIQGNPILGFMMDSSFLIHFVLHGAKENLKTLHRIAMKLGEQLDQDIDLKTTKPSPERRAYEEQMLFLSGMKRKVSKMMQQETTDVPTKRSRIT